MAVFFVFVNHVVQISRHKYFQAIVFGPIIIPNLMGKNLDKQAYSELAEKAAEELAEIFVLQIELERSVNQKDKNNARTNL